MKRVLQILHLLTIITVICLSLGCSLDQAIAQELSPTPTYDPLVEPPLPTNPTEMELGRNLYWNWCMTCHGDRGQGLTDEWRAVWEEDHQNCWERGCHAGNNGKGDEVFIIPTVIPLIIGEDHLAQFNTLKDLSNYLMLTHPPQHPGILAEEEYNAIAVYVFTQNDRPLATKTPSPTHSTPTLVPSATVTPVPVLSPTRLTSAIPTPTITLLLPSATPYRWLVFIAIIILPIVFVWLYRKGVFGKTEDKY